jgi:hypothetical protein
MEMKFIKQTTNEFLSGIGAHQSNVAHLFVTVARLRWVRTKHGT